MRFAYADPPYLGCCGLYDHHHEHPYGCWNELETHEQLFDLLEGQFPDGWALSSGSSQLQDLLMVAPRGVRIAVWVKPFSSYKPNVNPAYAWEPVLFTGGRRGDRSRPTVRDYHIANITLMKGVIGAKPATFCRWILELLGYEEGDELVDLFPGTGLMDVVTGKTPLQTGLFEETHHGLG